MNSVSEFLGLDVVRKLALHPNKIRERSIGNSAVNRALGTALVPVVTLSGAGSFPVEVDVDTSDALSKGTRLSVALALGGLQVALDETGLVCIRSRVDSVDNSVVKELETGLGDPLVFNCLKLDSVLAGLLGSHHQIVQRLEVRVGRADNEAVVTVVNSGSDESCCFRIGSGDSKKIGAWNKTQLDTEQQIT